MRLSEEKLNLASDWKGSLFIQHDWEVRSARNKPCLLQPYLVIVTNNGFSGRSKVREREKARLLLIHLKDQALNSRKDRESLIQPIYYSLVIDVLVETDKLNVKQGRLGELGHQTDLWHLGFLLLASSDVCFPQQVCLTVCLACVYLPIADEDNKTKTINN